MTQARAKQDMRKVRLVGIDETSLKSGQDYITVVHDLDEKRLLFATPGCDHATVERFALDLQAHGCKRTPITNACIDMSAAFAKGIAKPLPKAQINYDRYHVVALDNQATDEVRSAEWKADSQRVRDELGELDASQRRAIPDLRRHREAQPDKLERPQRSAYRHGRWRQLRRQVWYRCTLCRLEHRYQRHHLEQPGQLHGSSDQRREHRRHGALAAANRQRQRQHQQLRRQH